MSSCQRRQDPPAGMHAARGATNRAGRQIAAPDACGSPPGCSAPLRGRLLAMATLLHHWAYAASINIPDAIRRRFLGVVGLARQPVTLMVKALQAPFRLALLHQAREAGDGLQPVRPSFSQRHAGHHQRHGGPQRAEYDAHRQCAASAPRSHWRLRKAPSVSATPISIGASQLSLAVLGSIYIYRTSRSPTARPACLLRPRRI